MRRTAIITGLVALAPIIVFAAMVGAAHFQDERRDTEAFALAQAREINAHVDAELNGTLDALSVLATAPPLVSRDWPRARVRSQEVLDDHSSWRDVYLTDVVSGRELWSARGDRDREPARDEAVAFVEGVDAGRRISNVGGLSSQCPCVVVHQPILSGDRMRYLLSVELSLQDIQAGVERRVRGPEIVGVVDRLGVIIARSKDPRERVGRPASASVRAALAGGGAGVYEGATLEGVRSRTAYETSVLSGFSTHVGVPAGGLTLLGAGSFGLQALALLLALAAAAGGAIFVLRQQERSRIEERAHARAEQLAAVALMNRIGEAVRAEVDQDRAVQVITDAATELTDAELGAFFYNVVDGNGESYMLYAISGAAKEAFADFSMPRNTAIFRPTFSGEGVVRSDDITKDPRYGQSGPHYGMPKGHLPVRSYLAVPVVSRSGEVLGGLFFGHSKPARFSAEEEQVAVGVAIQAAIAIDNGRLYQAMHREIDRSAHAEADVKRLNEDLEERVGDRTRDLQSANEQFRLLVEGVTDYAIYMLDPDGRVSSWNAGAERIKEYRAAEILGQPFGVFFAPEDREAGLPESILEQARREGHVEVQGVRVRKSGVRFRADVVINALHNPQGDLIGFAKVTRDVSEKVATQANLDRMQQQLAQSQKLEALGQLTGGMAHDFNNMLAVITSAFQLSTRALERGEADKVRAFMASGLEAAKRAAELIKRLLAFARRQPLAPKSIDANAMVREMSEILRRTLGEQIELECVLAGGLWSLNADQSQLESGLINLAANARDAMSEGGKLTIETSNAHLDDRYAAEHLGVPPSQYVLIAVSDTGIGMTPDQVEKAFEPFFTTKGDSGGSGLGLAQVYGFVQQSGGHARIYSEPGRGTTVKLYLPRANGTPAPARPLPSEAAPLGSAHQCILVVEDEPRVRHLTSAALRELGYTVLEAEGGEAALKLIEAHPEIALLFTDVVMPKMDGRKLATAVQALRPELPVLFTTGFTKNAIIHGGALDADTKFIAKPFTLEDLARKVREVLSGGG